MTYNNLDIKGILLFFQTKDDFTVYGTRITEPGSPKNRIFWDFNDTRLFFPLMTSLSSKFGLFEDVFFIN